MSEILPSLSALRAFEAAARHLSMKRASEELGVTPGAISLHVRELEASLGLALFERHPRQLALTEAGAEYFLSLRSAFRLMREATHAVRSRQRPDIVTLSCTTGFALQWLMPRLDQFLEDNPDIDLRIGTTARLVDFVRDRVDLGIRHGLGSYPGLLSDRLIDDDFIVVASPAQAASLGHSALPAGLTGERLIHDVDRNDWRLWLEEANAPEVDWRKGVVIAADSNGALEAARAGLGFALVRRGFAEQDLDAGRLVAPFSQSLKSRFAYYVVYPPEALERAAVRRVRAWILAQAGLALR